MECVGCGGGGDTTGGGDDTTSRGEGCAESCLGGENGAEMVTDAMAVG